MQSAEVLARRRKYQLTGFEKSQTVQADKDRCDVNNIIAKCRKTGIVTHVNNRVPFQGDYSQVGDFASMLNTVIAAQQSFAALPSKVRREFDNDPAKFVEFMSNDANAEEMVRLGLAERVEAPSATPPRRGPSNGPCRRRGSVGIMPSMIIEGVSPSRRATFPHSYPLDVTVRSDTRY